MPRNTGNEGRMFGRTEARTIIKNYQQTDHFQKNKIKGGLFGKNNVLAILNQPGCTALRYYFALTATQEPTIVLVGEDANGETLSDGLLYEEGPLCPPWCPDKNDLDV